jgi:hypothetical protein
MVAIVIKIVVGFEIRAIFPIGTAGTYFRVVSIDLTNL